jgi:phosphopantetheinyl transferase (holo-ACP synthase)
VIGNDIIDLAYARKTSNWRRPRWLGKLFSTAERTFIKQSNNPELSVWLLWSMKESAYKVIVQQEGKRFFAPKQVECSAINQNLQTYSGQVKYKSKIIYTQSEWNEAFVYTLAYPENQPSPIVSEVLSFPDTAESRYWLHQQVVDRFTREAKFLAEAPRIQKNNQGVPHIFSGNTQQSTSLSISHHGRFGAFSFVEL